MKIRFTLIALIITLCSVNSYAFNQKFYLKAGKLQLSGESPWFPSTPLELSGVTENNLPYKLTINTGMEDHGHYNVEYILEYQGKKVSGKIVKQMGAEGQHKPKRSQDLIFKITVNN